MRRDDQIVTAYVSPARLHDHRLLVDGLHGCVGKNETPVTGYGADQRLQIFQRMKRGLLREPHTGAMHARHLFHECRVEAERPGQLHVVLQSLARCGLLVLQRGMQIARLPAKITVGVGLADNRRDLIDRSSTGLPKRLGSVVTEGVGQFVEALISDVREMCGGAAGVTRGDPVPFEQRDSGTCLLEEIRRGDAGEPGPDHHDIDLDVAINGGKIRQCVGRRPI